MPNYKSSHVYIDNQCLYYKLPVECFWLRLLLHSDENSNDID